jgi:hypothetical protein
MDALKTHVMNALLALLLGPWGTLVGQPVRRRPERPDA